MPSPTTTIVLYQVGFLAITPLSIPSLIALPTYIAICLWLSVKSRTLVWWDALLIAGTALVQVALMPIIAGATTSHFGVFALSWPIIGFLSGYGAWRISGKRPLAGWTWYRVGLISSLLILAVDVASAFVIPPSAGKIWQLGGAGFYDALVLAPPLFMLTFYWLLDCRSPLVFCSKGCRDAKRCLYGIGDHAEQPPRIVAFSIWKRIVMSTVLSTAVFFIYTGFNQDDAKPTNTLSASVTGPLRRFIVETSTKYKIPPPDLIQIGGPAIAFTRKTANGSGVEICLGDHFQSNRSLIDDPKIAKAIIAHELGHGILYARNQGFPPFLLLGTYILSLAALLCALPTRRGTALGSLFILATLTAETVVLGIAPHAAIQEIILTASCFGVIGVLFCKGMSLPFGSWGSHFPGRIAFFAATCSAFSLFVLGMPAIGALNTDRELFADRVAACEAGVDQIADALGLIHPQNRHPFFEMLLDPFHPTSGARLEALTSLKDQDLPAVCDRLRLGS